MLVFPHGFEERLSDVRRAHRSEREATPTRHGVFPSRIILYNSADDKSQLAQLRVEQILRRWRNADHAREPRSPATCRSRRRRRSSCGRATSRETQQQQAAVWSKVLPFFVFIWALTGAFYPAVDLCAGEKERGTLETLLTSPALRREIVWGKLLTVMTFSIATAMLNLGSLGITGKFVIDN